MSCIPAAYADAAPRKLLYRLRHRFASGVGLPGWFPVIFLPDRSGVPSQARQGTLNLLGNPCSDEVVTGGIAGTASPTISAVVEVSDNHELKSEGRDGAATP